MPVRCSLARMKHLVETTHVQQIYTVVKMLNRFFLAPRKDLRLANAGRDVSLQNQTVDVDSQVKQGSKLQIAVLMGLGV